MSLSQKILKNTAVQVAGKLVGTVISLIAASIVLRYLSPEGFGKYNIIVSFLQIFGILMDFGLYIVLVKKISTIEESSSPLVNTIFTLRLISGIIFLSIAPLAAWILGMFSASYTPEIISGIALTALFFLFISLNQLLSAVFQKQLRTDWIALAELIGKLTLLAVTVIVVWLDLGLLWIMTTLVLSSGMNFLVNFLASKKYLHIQLSLNWNMCKEIIREAWPIALSIGLVLLYFKGDIIILTFFHTSNELIGIYGAPYKILEVLVTFPAMFTGLILPSLSAAWQTKDHDRFQHLFQRSFDALTVFAIPLIAGTWAVAPYIIEIVAGPEYLQSVPILNILIIATASIFLGTLFGYVVVAIDKQRTMLYGYAFVAATSLIGYVTFIPRYSITGAAWVTAYSEILVAIISLGIIMKSTRTSLQFRTIIKSIIASGIMYGVLSMSFPLLLIFTTRLGLLHIPHMWLTVLWLSLLICIAVVVYIVCMFAIKGLHVQEIKELLSKKKR